MNPEHDAANELQEAVRVALATGAGVRITGSGSKSGMTGALHPPAAVTPVTGLSTLGHTGIVAYRPEELVVTVRAGTSLEYLQQVLAEHQQQLPFDPPQFDGGGTIGGAVACGLSGPGRPWLGSVRDCLLGVEMINGLGERLRFGGEVMKNVAGYDISRLQAGAFGTLGLLLAVSLKLLPVAPFERTLVLEADAAGALEKCRELARRAYPVTATCSVDDRLWIRLSGAEASVKWASGKIGGALDETPGWWRMLRDHRHPFFGNRNGVWRWVVAPATPVTAAGCLVEWGGSLRWRHQGPGISGTVPAIPEQGGFAQRFDASFARQRVAGGDGPDRRYHRRLRTAFDPETVFNPGLSVNHAD